VVLITGVDCKTITFTRKNGSKKEEFFGLSMQKFEKQGGQAQFLLSPVIIFCPSCSLFELNLCKTGYLYARCHKKVIFSSIKFSCEKKTIERIKDNFLAHPVSFFVPVQEIVKATQNQQIYQKTDP
jgi:hypothetical protein